ncbi:MAG: M3 family metallopeptidase, partial [Bryobacteraceae bacterium]
MNDNPLLEPRYRVPFDKIRATHVEPAMSILLEDAARRLERAASADTLNAVDRLTENLDYAMTLVRHLEAVTTCPELRAAYNAVEPRVSAFYSRIPLNEPLWRAIKAYQQSAEAQALAGARRRFLTKTIDSFRRHGADLDAAGKAKLEEIDVEMAKLCTQFSERVLDSTNAFELVVTDESKLAGLPESAVTAARESAASKNVDGWRFTLQQPSYIAVMTYLEDPGLRETVYRAYQTRATCDPHDNRDGVARILELRRRKAELLGFADFADFVLADRMAGSGARARSFLDELHRRSEPFFRGENEELQTFRGAPPLEPWDIGYYAEKLRRERYDFDEEMLRPYFPLEKVVAGMFALVERLFGISVQQDEGVAGWDPNVRCYRIADLDGTHLGGFYADWYPRENKRGGAWMDAFITGGPRDGGFAAHLGAICGNLSPPVGGRPALLTHRDVETIFHEFGHLLHHCLSRVEVRSLSGTSVPWDFVELPSQIMENWCWEREALDLFAAQWETGERIPEELFARMKRARTFRSANAMMRQLGFGITDLALHSEYRPEKDGDPIEYGRRMIAKFSPSPLPAGHAALAAFTHLFGNPVGYAAGYYSYKWAEVLDADAFTRFRSEGVFSREAGLAFRRSILERGDSEDPMVLFRQYMGR